ncbi:6-phosphogluconate dehydrogenase, decarboxylating [Metarhizium guizhouense ARSEF 977]|uniref:phosphogluconate dehydrogenase (NADP(+)-dependent, decarboxylating) n=1 Tax=Metarhizium guizhouense (strain ARSEF 977) TaxID=1276136 RepID=A0A0B4I1J7_METGA|nr:6-phosphogluconate dehydrogenase, decarboxylating [Metarhizium guizhouense ARSEF 977]
MDAQSDAAIKLKRIGIVGAGNMGSTMGFAFSELGLDVSVWDGKSANIDRFMTQVSQCEGLKGKSTGFYDKAEFAASLGERSNRKVFIISITHSDPADQVLSKLRPELNEGHIIMDGGNEHYRDTERRQKECRNIGMVHNGIEVGMLSALCEAWGFLNTGMGLDCHQIGQVFQQWNNEGELNGTFLVKIAADVCKARKGNAIMATNAKLDSCVGRELQRNYGVLKDIVSRGLAYDHYMPNLSATLEYMKCSGGTMLPTRFMEAQMDYFGAHSYDKPGVLGEDPGPVA